MKGIKGVTSSKPKNTYSASVQETMDRESAALQQKLESEKAAKPAPVSPTEDPKALEMQRLMLQMAGEQGPAENNGDTQVEVVEQAIPAIEPVVVKTESEVAATTTPATQIVAAPVAAKQEDEPDAETSKSTTKPAGRQKRQADTNVDQVAYINEDGIVVFNEQFQIRHAKRNDFGAVNFSVPREIALEAKTKAMREDLSMFELHNLLYAMYLEHGITPAILKRYRKSIKKD